MLTTNEGLIKNSETTTTEKMPLRVELFYDVFSHNYHSTLSLQITLSLFMLMTEFC